MQHLSISEVRRTLPTLAQTMGAFTLTHRGHDVATVHMTTPSRFDPVRAKLAGARIAAIAARATFGKTGGTHIIRQLRDGA